MSVFFKILIGLGVLVFTIYEGIGLYKDIKKRKLNKVTETVSDDNGSNDSSIKSNKEE